jgi:hypothetical protein
MVILLASGVDLHVMQPARGRFENIFGERPMPAPLIRYFRYAFERRVLVDILLPVIAGTAIAYMVVNIVGEEELIRLLAAALVFVIAFAFALSNYRRALLLAVFCLPFTQVPTLKFFLRWRISEVISWLFLPQYLLRYIQLSRQHAQTTRWFVSSLFCYAVYTGLVGIASCWLVEVEVEGALDYFTSPLFRTLLETGRLLAALSLIVGLFRTIENVGKLQQLLGLLAWSGSIAGAYGVYQSIALWIGLPLLPETLWHEGTLRPFGTFYEPTGLRSFTAATSLLALFFLFHEQHKFIWTACLLLNFAGLLFSLSRAGLAGFGVGLFVMWILLLLRWRMKSLVTCAVSLAIAVLGIGLAYKGAAVVMGEADVAFAMSEHWLRQTGQSRIDAYTSLPVWVMASPAGLGQGLYFFTGGGIPGFSRLLIEGGMLGTMVLLFLHAAALRSLGQLWQSKAAPHIVPFLAAAYISSVVIMFNYVNTTDMWIWCFWALPTIAWQAVTGHRKQSV